MTGPPREPTAPAGRGRTCGRTGAVAGCRGRPLGCGARLSAAVAAAVRVGLWRLTHPGVTGQPGVGSRSL